VTGLPLRMPANLAITHVTDGPSSSKKSHQPRLTFSLPQDQLDHVKTRAAAAFGGVESRYLQSLIRSDMAGSFKGAKRVIRMSITAEEIASDLGLHAFAPVDADNPSVDLVIEELRIGLEFKARFREASNEQGMMEAITFSFAMKHCDEVWIVLDDEMPEAEAARFKAVGANFTSGKVKTVRIRDLADALRDRLQK
jgi:hypothetical protein